MAEEQRLRDAIQANLDQGNYAQCLIALEELELLDAEKEGDFPEDYIGRLQLQMALYLMEDDLDNARHLWRGAPAVAKDENGPLAKLWAVVAALWRGDAPGAYAKLNQPWDDSTARLVPAITERVRERALAQAARAYRRLPLAVVAPLAGLADDPAAALRACLARGWARDPEAPEVLVPAAAAAGRLRAAGGKVGGGGGGGGGRERLRRLTEYVAFLEQQGLPAVS